MHENERMYVLNVCTNTSTFWHEKQKKSPRQLLQHFSSLTLFLREKVYTDGVKLEKKQEMIKDMYVGRFHP